MALTEMQRQYRRFFGDFTDRRRIDALDQREVKLFAEVWPLWFAYAMQPDRVMGQPIRDAPELHERTVRRLVSAIRRELLKCDKVGVTLSVVSGNVYWQDEPVLWLTVDGDDGLDVYNAADPALDAARRAILSIDDSELRQYALKFHCQSIAILPLIRGRSLAGTAWRVNTELLARVDSVQSLGWLQMPMQPVSQEALEQLGIQVWDDENLNLGTRLVEAVSRLWPLVVHMAELSRMPEVEGLGEELVLRHIEETMISISNTAQPVVDAIADLSVALSEHIAGTSEQPDSMVVQTSEALQELLRVTLPTEGFAGSATLKVQEFEPWAERLREGLQYAVIAQLAWASVTLRAATS